MQAAGKQLKVAFLGDSHGTKDGMRNRVNWAYRLACPRFSKRGL